MTVSMALESLNLLVRINDFPPCHVHSCQIVLESSQIRYYISAFVMTLMTSVQRA